jgi:hypothetical protein
MDADPGDKLVTDPPDPDLDPQHWKCSIRSTVRVLGSVADPHHFNAVTDPSVHLASSTLSSVWYTDAEPLHSIAV